MLKIQRPIFWPSSSHWKIKQHLCILKKTKPLLPCTRLILFIHFNICCLFLFSGMHQASLAMSLWISPQPPHYWDPVSHTVGFTPQFLSELAAYSCTADFFIRRLPWQTPLQVVTLACQIKSYPLLLQVHLFASTFAHLLINRSILINMWGKKWARPKLCALKTLTAVSRLGNLDISKASDTICC